jgi:hypothetical protein
MVDENSATLCGHRETARVEERPGSYTALVSYPLSRHASNTWGAGDVRHPAPGPN